MLQFRTGPRHDSLIVTGDQGAVVLQFRTGPRHDSLIVTGDQGAVVLQFRTGQRHDWVTDDLGAVLL